MNTLKRATKACLKPVYRRLVKPLCRPLLRRLRDYLVAPYRHLDEVASAAVAPAPSTALAPLAGAALVPLQQVVAGELQHVHGQLAALVAHTAQLHHVTNELATRARHFEDALRETDHLLLALIKGADLQGRPGPAEASRAPTYVGAGRLLAPHPYWPCIFLDADEPLVTPQAVAQRYEPGVRAALERLIRPGDTVVEAGAGQGYHTLTLAALVGPAGAVVALEPDPRPAGFLSRSLLCNDLGHVVQLRQAAAYHEAGAVALHPGPSGCTSLSSVLPRPEGGPAVEVCAVRLDDVFAREGLRPDFIRLDVNGAEGLALGGMWDYLHAAADVTLMLPFCAEVLKRAGGPAPEELLGRLTGIGFTFQAVADDGSLLPVTPEAILERFNSCPGQLVAGRGLGRP
jgi:FkbM family methyltransferase